MDYTLNTTTGVFLLSGNNITVFDYLASMIAVYKIYIGELPVYLAKNNRYEVVDQFVEVYADGKLSIYHRVYYNSDNNILIPEDYCVVAPRASFQQDRSMVDRFYRENKDSTTDYTEAYKEGMGIVRNPLPDIAAKDYQESDELTRVVE